MPEASIEFCLTAPGEAVIGALAAGTAQQGEQILNIDGIAFSRGGGTSFAAPQVAAMAMAQDLTTFATTDQINPGDAAADWGC